MIDPDTAAQMLASRAAQTRRTEGEPESLAYSDIFAFNQGNISLIYVGHYLLERQANEVRWLEGLKGTEGFNLNPSVPFNPYCIYTLTPFIDVLYLRIWEVQRSKKCRN